MKKLFKLFAVIITMVLLITSFASCFGKTNKKLVEYKNDGLGISFERPEVWREMVSTDTGVVYIYENDNTSLSIGRSKVEETIDLDIATTNTEATLKGQYVGFELIEKKTDVKVGDLKATKFVFKDTTETEPKTYVKYLIISGEYGYFIDCSCQSELYNETSKDFNAVINSIKFIPITASTPE